MIEISERIEPITHGVVSNLGSDACMKIRQFDVVSPELVPWLAHVWSVEWSLAENVKRTQKTVPFPAYNLIVDSHLGCALFGCSSASFDYQLKGSGQVIGFRFKPAAQAAFWNGEPSTLTDGSLPTKTFAKPDLNDALVALRRSDISGDTISGTVTMLQQYSEPVSKAAQKTETLVNFISQNRQINRLSDLAISVKMSERSIQRRFHDHLGISPKLVIDRFRMHDALKALHGKQELDLAGLAADLNYADQAHFSNVFRRLTGVSPGAYRDRNH